MNERSISFCSDEIFRGVFWPFYSFLKILCKILAFKWAINKINTYFLAFEHYLFLSNLISVIANPQQQFPTHTDTDDQTLLYLSTPQPQAPHFLERLKGANANYFFRKFPFASFIFFNKFVMFHWMESLSVALTAALFSSLLLEIISVWVAVLVAATSATVGGKLGSSLQLYLVPTINDDAESSSSNNEASNAGSSPVIFLPVVLCNVLALVWNQNFYDILQNFYKNIL